MQSDGKKASYNPAATLASLLGKREKLQEELHNIEKQVYELETSYLQESSHFGNALKGFDGFLSASKNTTNLKRSRKFQPEDRIFSLSSVTSPALFEYSTTSCMERILERYERYSYAERQLVAADIDSQVRWTLEHVKLQARLEVLDRTQRHFMGEDLDTLSVKELQSLEHQLDSALKHIRSRKNQLMNDSISELQTKDKIRAEEQGVGRDDGRSDLGQGRPKGGGLATNGQGKPKKGRAGGRDAKKIRMSSDLDPEDEDDPDLGLR
ncbi:unnamed protein product [Camellia sinensis]